MNTPPGVDLAMGRDPETLKFLLKWRVEAALLCKGAYDGGAQEERELMDIFLSNSGHDSFASWFKAKSFDDSEMPNTPRDSWADHLLMTWLAKRLGVTLFCVVVNEGSRSAPFALNEEPNPGAPQVTARFKPLDT